MEQYFEKWKAEYRARVLEEIETGYLPTWVAEILDQRLDELRFEYLDFMNSPKIGDMQLWHIRIASGTILEDRRHSFFHEVTHALMGREIVIAYGAQGATKFRILNLKRTGLQSYSFSKGGITFGCKNRGINEAVTEEVAKKLSGYPHNNNYQFEFMEMQGMIMRGELTEKDLIWAAFEDTHFEGQDRPHWKALTDKVSEDRLNSI